MIFRRVPYSWLLRIEAFPESHGGDEIKQVAAIVVHAIQIVIRTVSVITHSRRSAFSPGVVLEFFFC